MMLEYIELFYHQDRQEYSVYMQYMVEDHNRLKTNAEKIIIGNDHANITQQLINLVQDNVTMVHDLKFNLGNYNQFDLVLDFFKLLDDIELIIGQEKSALSEDGIRYIEVYRSLFERILELEMDSSIDHNQIRDYSRILLKSFEHYVYDFYIDNKEIEFSCIIEDNFHNDNLLVDFIGGIPISYCSNHQLPRELVRIFSKDE